MNLTTGRKEIACKSVGGIKFVYLFKYVDYAYTQIVGTRGQEVTSFPATDIYAFEVNRASFTENVVNNEQGLSYDQSLTFDLKKQDRFSQQDLVTASNIELRFIIKLNDGRFKIGGLFNGASLEFETDSGGGKETFNGYRITVTAQEEWQSAFIDDLSSAGFTVSQTLLLEDGDDIYTEDFVSIILE